MAKDIKNYAPQGSKILTKNNEIIDIGEYFKNVFNSNFEDVLDSIDNIDNKNIYGTFGGVLSINRRADLSSSFEYGFDSSSAILLNANGGTITIDESRLKISSGNNINGIGGIQTVQNLRYRAGREAEAMFTAVWSPKKIGLTSYVGIFDANDGFFLGNNGLNFCITKRRAGVDTIVNQSNFNVDKLDGTGKSGFTINTESMNVFRIVWGYLGKAPIQFQIMINDRFETFHIVNELNNGDKTTITSPYLPIRAEVKNNGIADGGYVMTASIYMGRIDGNEEIGFDSSSRTFSEAKDGTFTTGTIDIATFYNPEVFNLRPNKISALLNLVSFATIGNKGCRFELWKTRTVPTGAGFVDYDAGNSIMKISTVATNPSLVGAKRLLAFGVSANGRITEDVSHYNLLLFPGEYAFFRIVGLAGGSTTEYVFTNRWSELF